VVTGVTQTGSLVPRLVQQPVPMIKIGTLDSTGYSLYTAAYNITDHISDFFTTYDVMASANGQQYTAEFLPWGDIGTTCPGYNIV